jgi:hypothetical protein
MVVEAMMVAGAVGEVVAGMATGVKAVSVVRVAVRAAAAAAAARPVRNLHHPWSRLR